MGAEDRLQELGIELPPPPQPLASYVQVSVSGGFAYVSGQVPIAEGKLLWTGVLGNEVDVVAGADAARRCALQALSALRAEIGSLDRVKKIVKLAVFVASAAGFTDQPKVANGASDLLAEVFGESGRHARTAVGVSGLPLGAPVEVEVIAEIGP
ncbi:MAG TPA: RidA family protein [Actinomycetota bacterium]|jgi:enamine deaminase RidA (YjgF/YER057c/UK114 family)